MPSAKTGQTPICTPCAPDQWLYPLPPPWPLHFGCTETWLTVANRQSHDWGALLLPGRHPHGIGSPWQVQRYLLDPVRPRPHCTLLCAQCTQCAPRDQCGQCASVHLSFTCTCTSPALHPTPCNLHACAAQPSLLLQESRPPGCAPRLATWSRLSIPLSRLQQPVLIQTHKMPLSPISSTSTGSRNRKGQEYVLRMGGRVAPVVIKVHCPDPDWNPSFYRPWKALIPPVQSVTVRLGSGGCTRLGQTVRNVQVLCLVLSDWVLQQGRNRQPWPSHQPYGTSNQKKIINIDWFGFYLVTLWRCGRHHIPSRPPSEEKWRGQKILLWPSSGFSWFLSRLAF